MKRIACIRLRKKIANWQIVNLVILSKAKDLGPRQILRFAQNAEAVAYWAV